MTKKILASALVAISAFGILSFWYRDSVRGAQDITIYERIATKISRMREGETVTPESEYPPLASSLFVLIRENPFRMSFSASWLTLLLLALAATAFYAGKYFNRRDLAILPIAMALSVLLLSQELLFARYDILVALLLFLAWKSHVHEHYGFGWFFLLIACALKIVPLVLIPLFFVMTPWKKHMRGGIIGIVAGIAVATIIPLLVMGPETMIQNIRYVLEYQGDRGIQGETTWSGMNILYHFLLQEKATLAFHHLAIHNEEFGSGTVLLTRILWIVGTIGIAILALRRRKKNPNEPIGSYVIATLLWILGTSPLLSPQFFVWVVPLLVLLLLEEWMDNPDRRTTMLTIWTVIVALATQWIYPLHYEDFVDQKSLSIVLIHNLRNISIFVLVWLLLKPTMTKFGMGKIGILLRKFRGPVTLIVPIVGVFLVGLLWWQSSITLGTATYRFNEGADRTGEMPLFVPTEGDILRVSVPVTMHTLHPRLLRLKPDDCLESLMINGVSVDPALVQFCDYGDGKTINLGKFLHPGRNIFSFTLKDSGGLGGVNISAARTDPLILLRTLLLLLLLLLAVGLIRLWSKTKTWSALAGIFVAGTMLRIWHFFSTHYNTRGHDTGAHIDYIKYVFEHWRIPPAVEGWEYHQPPLYYMLAAVFGKISETLGAAWEMTLTLIQAGSLLFSIVTFGIILWISHMLFPEKKDQKNLILFGLLLLSFPPLLYLSARISNDALYQVIAFGFLAFLLRFWQKGKLHDWSIVTLILAIGVLTKVSTIALFPIAYLCLLFAPKLSLKKKIVTGTLSLILVIILSGWLPAYRLLEGDPNRTLSLGNEGMSDGLLVETTPATFLTFNPLEILAHPFNNTWVDEERRQYFWEFFFRSAFFDEFTFPDPLRAISVGILLCAMLLLPVIAFGIWKELRKNWRAGLPLTLTLLFLLASSVSYRLKFPYAPNQDFRFVVLLAVPLAYFAIRGAAALPAPYARIATGILLLLSALSTVFIFLLYFF